MRPTVRQQALFSEFFCCLVDECPLLIGQVFKVDLKDHLIIHVDDCGPIEHAKIMWMVKSDWIIRCQAHEARREKSRGADPDLSSGLRRTLDRMVMTEGVPVNLTL